MSAEGGPSDGDLEWFLTNVFAEGFSSGYEYAQGHASWKAESCAGPDALEQVSLAGWVSDLRALFQAEEGTCDEATGMDDDQSEPRSVRRGPAAQP